MPQYELNLRDYWQVIQKRKLVILVILLAVLIPNVIHSNMQKTVYRAVASVQWIERRNLASLLVQLVDSSLPIGDPLVAQSRIITSLPVLEKVVKELGLVDEHASADEIIAQAAAIQGAVSTSIATGTNIIYINVTYANPKMAADIANKIAEVYIAENLKEKTKQSRTVREFIEKQLEEVSVKLRNSEDKLARFKETEVPTGEALPLQSRLAELQEKRQSILRIYTELHPDVKNINEEIIRVQDRLKVLPQKELEYIRLERDVEINVSLYRDFKLKLEAARIAEAEKVEDVSLVDSAAPGAPIKPNKTLNYLVGTMIGLVLGLAATSVMEQLDTSIGTIEDVESFIKLPVLGVIPYLRIKDEKRKGFIRRMWQKEFKGREKVLHLRNQLVIHFSSSSPAFEAYRILRTNIKTEIFKEQIKGKKILLSSAGPEEGKSITAANLAIAMAQDNLRTLLIDGDMRRSVIHNIFGLKDKEPGLSNVLRESIKPENAIRTFTDILMGELGFDEALKLPGLDKLSILTSGSSPSLSAELLSSQEMTVLLENLKEKFDIILIDSPPVMAVADASILATRVDAVILVYRVGKTARSVLARSKAQIIDSGGLVKGLILNNISPEIEMRYGYYYHYKYYSKYYTDKKAET